MAGAAIFIGIGGIGGSIVAKVRQSLEIRMRAAGDNPASQEARDQFQFVLLDTWRDAAAAAFTASEFVQIPGGAGEYGVDRRIDALYYGDDTAFAGWWPRERSGMPMRTGDLAFGAGQLRIKGKMAYRIHLSGQERLATSAVASQLSKINNILGPAQGMRTIPIYIVCSLGGGSGSGMALAFAAHLRQLVGDNLPIIGVFPLASVTRLGPGGADSSSVCANTDAALREIDYMQRVAGTSDNMLEPFFQWPGAGNRIEVRERPFSYCYLFGRENQNSLSFTSFDQYVDQIAECLVSESFSELIGEATMDAAISGPHSQFMQMLHARREMLGRPTTYASAAVGSVRYPARRVTVHLARTFARKVLDRMVEADSTKAVSAANEFLTTNGILWGDLAPLEYRLDEDVRQGTPEAAGFQGLNGVVNARWEKADPREAALRARDSRDELEGWIKLSYQPHVSERRQEIIAEYSGPNGQLTTAVEGWLREAGPTGLGFALRAVEQIRTKITSELADAIKRVNGESGPDGEQGLRRERADMLDEAAWGAAVTRLENGFGFLNRGGDNAKSTFVRTTWQPAVDISQQFVRAEAAVAIYRAMESETDRVLLTLQTLVEQTFQKRDELERAARTDLGTAGLGGSLDVDVLDDADLAEHHFGKLLERIIANESDAAAASIVAIEDGVLGAFRKRLATRGGAGQLNEDYRGMLERRAVGAGEELLGSEVDALSIWDALDAELNARLALGKIDRVLADAEAETRRQRSIAEQQGLVRDDWSDVLLQTFVRGKLLECRERVRPFWRLDPIRAESHGAPYEFTVITRDKHVYESAKRKHGLGDVLDETAELMKAGRPYELPGRHAISLYARQGVAPLAYLDPTELRAMRDSAAQVGAYKFLYTDDRFARAVDPVIAPAESPDNLVRYLVCGSDYLGLFRPAGESLNGNLSFGDDEWHSAEEAYRAIKSNPDLRKRLTRRFNEQLREFDAPVRERTINEARLKVRQRLRDARESGLGGEAAFWESAERAMTDRIGAEQFLINE
jgi:hypothetical protein